MLDFTVEFDWTLGMNCILQRTELFLRRKNDPLRISRLARDELRRLIPHRRSPASSPATALSSERQPGYRTSTACQRRFRLNTLPATSPAMKPGSVDTSPHPGITAALPTTTTKETTASSGQRQQDRFRLQPVRRAATAISTMNLAKQMVTSLQFIDSATGVFP
jgi:hypothetical protein